MATKSEDAYKKILKLLLQRHFAGDNRFSVREMAKILNMSVVPISEAIRRLQQLGLVICQPRKKIRIRILTTRELRDVMVIREGLECQSVNLLTRFATPKILQDLKVKADKIDEAIHRQDLESLPQLDFDFHTALARASRCKLLADKIEEFAILTLICSDPRILDHSGDVGTHPKIIEMIGTGKPELAEQAIRNQLNGITKYLAMS